MTTSIAQMICEYLMLVLDVVRRRWQVLVLPVALALPAAVFAVKVMPKQYVAKSLVLVQSSNGAAANTQNINEQVRAIEAWLKSDHVLTNLLPELIDTSNITNKLDMSVKVNMLRSAIRFRPLGGTAYEISLTLSTPDGLGRKLETVLARIMESLTGPNQGIFSASQFVLRRRSEALRVGREDLHAAITSAGLSTPELVESYLKTIIDLNDRIASLTKNNQADSRAASLATDLAQQRQRTERLISIDPNVVSGLLQQYGKYQQAQAEFEPLRERLSAQNNNYVGIFDPTASLVIVGRPQDPIFGSSPAKKIAVAIVFLSILCACGLVLLLELFYPGVRMRSEFEDLAGVTVVARFPKLPST